MKHHPAISWGAWFLVFLFVSAGFGACCRRRRTYPAPPGRDLLALVRARNHALRGLRAQGIADQFTSKGRVKLTVFLLVGPGGRLRMEATVLDNTVAVLTSDGRTVRSLDLKKHVAYVGPARPCNVARIFGIPLEPEHVGAVLAGGVPVLKHERVRVLWDPCHGRDVLRLEDPESGLREDIWFRRVENSWRVEGAQVFGRDGGWMVKVEFRKFVSIQGLGPVPKWVRYRQKRPSVDLLLKFKKLERKVVIPEDAYTLSFPPGYPVRMLDCAGRVLVPFEPLEPKAGARPVGDRR